MNAELKIRPISPADAETCGRIIYEAFKGIAERHNFPLDFPSTEAATGLTGLFIGHPAIFGVAAESDGKFVGSNFLDERDPIRCVGPITVDPGYQGRGCGKKLMQAVIDRGRGAAGIRLVQDAFNTVSMSLYTSLGFEAKEPLALMRGTPSGSPSGDGEARLLREEDLETCAALCRQVHGFDRTNELRDAIGMFRPMVWVRQGRVVAYASAPTFYPLNHGVAQTEQDMADLLLGAGAANAEPISLLVPIRGASLFRWCLGAGLRVVKPMTLMAMGEYREPKGSFFPSVQY